MVTLALHEQPEIEAAFRLHEVHDFIDGRDVGASGVTLPWRSRPRYSQTMAEVLCGLVGNVAALPATIIAPGAANLPAMADYASRADRCWPSSGAAIGAGSVTEAHRNCRSAKCFEDRPLL